MYGLGQILQLRGELTEFDISCFRCDLKGVTSVDLDVIGSV